ncbi:MAG: permease, partial [Elusimicrobiaceae bacterium]|nr:permease [Elusimicrobiaceae bacterium]
MEFIKEIAVTIFSIFNEMSFYLLLGFLFAGILHAFVPQRLFSKYLSQNNWASVFYATLFGIPLPLCSCGVIPTALALYKEGASKGATVAFLIATPQTGVDSIIATYSLLGLPFAV